CIVLLVVQNDLASSGPFSRHFVVSRPNQDAAVALADQLEDRAPGKQRNVVAVRLNRGKYFSLERPTGPVALDPHIRLLGNLAQHALRRTRRATAKQRIAGECSADECSPLHNTPSSFQNLYFPI